MALPASDIDEPICPVCGDYIGVSDQVGGTIERLLHLECWLRERERARRAPPRSKPE